MGIPLILRYPQRQPGQVLFSQLKTMVNPKGGKFQQNTHFYFFPKISRYPCKVSEVAVDHPQIINIITSSAPNSPNTPNKSFLSIDTAAVAPQAGSMISLNLS